MWVLCHYHTNSHSEWLVPPDTGARRNAESGVDCIDSCNNSTEELEDRKLPQRPMNRNLCSSCVHLVRNPYSFALCKKIHDCPAQQRSQVLEPSCWSVLPLRVANDRYLRHLARKC